MEQISNDAGWRFLNYKLLFNLLFWGVHPEPSLTAGPSHFLFLLIVQSLCNRLLALTSYSSFICFFFLFSIFSLVGLPGLISLLLLTSQMESFHQRVSCLNTTACKILWATPQQITRHPPHPELWPQARSRAQAPERSQTSCSHCLMEISDCS